MRRKRFAWGSSPACSPRSDSCPRRLPSRAGSRRDRPSRWPKSSARFGPRSAILSSKRSNGKSKPRKDAGIRTTPARASPPFSRNASRDTRALEAAPTAEAMKSLTPTPKKEDPPVTPETQTLPAAGTRVLYRVENGIAIFELNDPPANTYTYEMMRDLDDAILKARFDPGVHVVVIRGAGDKFFCAGANIKMLQTADPTFKYFFCLHANETLNRLEQTPKLVIAAINGHCVGGGLEIAMAADIRIAKRNAGKIGLPEVTLGVLPGTGGTQRMGRLVGKSRAIELMAEAATFPVEEARALGLVNTVVDVPAADFRGRALEYARKF